MAFAAKLPPMQAVITRFARRFRFLRLLRLSLVLGALYELALAAVLLAAPALMETSLGLPVPAERFFLRLLAVLLTMAGALFLFAARDPRRLSAVILVAIFGRLASAAALAGSALGNPELGSLFALAAVELAFGVLHAIFWLPVYS